MNNTYITEDDLQDLGVSLKGDDLNKLVEELNDKVDELVGEEIIDSLTPDDVEKLAAMQETASEEELAEWVVQHVPDYPEIIENNKDIVLGDFVEKSENSDKEDDGNE